MKASINERIGLIISKCNYKSRRAFAESINIAPTSLNGVLNGAEPKFSTLNNILIAEPNISAEWLIRGEGDMFRHAGQHVGDIIGSTAVVNHGDGNSIANNDTTNLQSKYLDLLAKKDQQIDRLLSIIEKLGK